MGKPRQFRSAGPMLLVDCTAKELERLRQAVASPGSKIKFIALYKTDNKVFILAQARDKMSVSMWREHLVSRLQNIVPVVNMRSAIEDARAQDGFEQFGFFFKREEAKDPQEGAGFLCVNAEALLAAHRAFQSTFKIWDDLLQSTVTMQRVCPSCRVGGTYSSKPPSVTGDLDPRPDPPHPPIPISY